MKKIISVICAFALLFSVFAVFVSAETTEERDESRNDEWFDLGVSSGYGEFINVEQFVKNAGKVIEGAKPIQDYTQLMLIALGQPRLDVKYDNSGSHDGCGYIVKYGFVGYFYNPMNCEFAFRSSYLMDDATIAGSVLYNDVTYSFSQQGYLANACLNETEIDEGYTTQLFLQVSYSIEVRVPVADNSVVIDKSKLKLYIDQLSLEGFGDIDGTGEYEKSFAIDFAVDDTIELTNHNAYIGKTTPTSDLMTFLDLSYVDLMKEYPLNKTENPKILQEPSIVYMYEERNTNRLYLYVYDEHAFGMFRPGNVAKGYVDISLGSNDNYKILSNLEYVSASDCFVKFCVNRISDNFDDAFSGDDSLYQIRGFSYIDKNGNRRTSEGYFVADFYYKNDAVDISFYSDYISLTDVKNTFYRLDSSANGSGYYQTLSSVYFTIPEYYFELHDDDYNNDRWIASIEGEYTEYMTNIGVVTSDDALYKWLTDDPNMKNVALYTGYYTDVYIAGMQEFYCRKYVGGKDPWQNNSSYINKSTAEFFDTYSYLYFVDEFEGLDAVFNFDLRDMLEKDVLKADDPFADEGKYNLFHLTKDDSFELISANEWTFSDIYANRGFWDALYAVMFKDFPVLSDSIKDIEVFCTLSGDTLHEKIVSFESVKTEEAKKALCDEFFVDIDDFNDVLKSMKDAYENNRVFVLFRFDVYDYYGEFQKDSDETFLFQEKYYEGFDILKIELENSYDSRVYDVRMAPISFVGGITRPSDPNYNVPEINFPELKLPEINWPPSSDFDRIFTSILVIGGVILGALVLMPIINAFIRRNRKNE